MEKPTTDEAVSKGSKIEAATASQDSNDLNKTGDVDAGTGTSVGVGVGAGNDAVDRIRVMPDSVHGATISRRVVNVAAGVMSCSAASTTPGGDASAGRGLV